MKKFKVIIAASLISLGAQAQIVDNSAKLPVYSYMAYSWSTARYTVPQAGTISGIKLFVNSEESAVLNKVRVYASASENTSDRQLVYDGNIQVNGKGEISISFSNAYTANTTDIYLTFEMNDGLGTSSLVKFETVADANGSAYNYNAFNQDYSSSYSANEHAKVEFVYGNAVMNVGSEINSDLKIERLNNDIQVSGLEKGNYIVTDMTGRVVKSGSISNNAIISLNNIEKGIYSVSIFNNGNKVHSSNELVK